MSELTMLAADARKMPLEDGSVQCIVTSPPYWGLRKYAGEQELIWPNGTRTQGIVCCNRGDHNWGGELELAGGAGRQGETSQRKGRANVEDQEFQCGRGNICILCGAWRGAYGLEPTIEMYIAHTVEILRECRRVLRSDGVLFWNMGDSYASGKGLKEKQAYPLNRGNKSDLDDQGLKPKDLCLIPARVALAAQADGWWVRSLIIWSKPNPMPESVTDRPTDSYEHIIMLTKSARYFWDADAVREPQSGNAHSRGSEECNEAYQSARESYYDFKSPAVVVPGGRNMRNVWNFPTQPYAGAHFATFPEEIPRRAILAATSARGCCTQCAAPWERVTREPSREIGEEYEGKHVEADAQSLDRRMLMNLKSSRDADFGDSFAPSTTIGFRPTCRCRGQRGRTAPCVVLDPFGGSGTTGRVAIELGRRAVLLDIAYSAEYAPLAAARTSKVQKSMQF